MASQGANRSMSAALRSYIRSVEPQTMLFKLVSVHYSRFLLNKQDAIECNTPASVKVDRHLLKLIDRSRLFQESICWLRGTNNMEVTVLIRKDVSQRHHVVISSIHQTPPSGCATFLMNDSFPFLHGFAVLCKKYDAVNNHSSMRHAILLLSLIMWSSSFRLKARPIT